MRYLKILLVCLFLVVSFISPVLAATVPGGNVVNFADITVPSDTTMDTVIVIGGNAYIDGHVKEDVVVLNGNAILSSTASVRERVIVLGGNMETENGAYIGKGVFQIGGNYAPAATLAGAGLLIVLLGFINIAITITVILIPAVIAWFCKNRVQEMSDIVQTSPVKVVIVGFLGGLAVATLSLVLSITIIGIPLALALLAAVLAVSLYGLGGVCCTLGRILPLKVSAEEKGTFMSTLYGAILLALFLNIPFIGIFALKLSLIASFGVIVIKMFTRKSDDA